MQSCKHALKELFVAKNGREKIVKNIDILRNGPLKGIFVREAWFHTKANLAAVISFFLPKNTKDFFFVKVDFFSVINIWCCPKNLKLFWKNIFLSKLAAWEKDCCFIKKK